MSPYLFFTIVLGCLHHMAILIMEINSFSFLFLRKLWAKTDLNKLAWRTVSNVWMKNCENTEKNLKISLKVFEVSIRRPVIIHSRDAWIGLHRQNLTWLFTDGSTLDYTGDVIFNSNHDCVRLTPQGNDWYCDRAYHFICMVTNIKISGKCEPLDKQVPFTFYRPPTKWQGGNVLGHLCLSFCPQ